MAMDLDLLHIKLTAYALGELDAPQKAEIERVLAESQDARDQVMRAKNVAKVIKELLPQMADDVQPMTPGEYLARSRHVDPPAPAPQPAEPAAAPPAAAAPDRGNGLVWLLAVACVGLTIGLAYNWKNPPAPAPVSDTGEIQALNQQLAHARKTAAETETTLAQLTQDKTALAVELQDSRASADELQAKVDGLEVDQQTAQQANAKLTAAYRRACALARAKHHPFASVPAQVLSSLPPSASSDSLASLEQSLSEGVLPPPDRIDASELVQALPYDYASPPPGQAAPLVTTAMAACPWAEGHVLACVAVTAGTVPVDLISVQTEFNPVRVGRWRLIGHENRLASGAVAGGQGTGTLAAGASLVALYELIPATDPLAPLLARRSDLVTKLAEAKLAVDAAANQAALAEAQFNFDALTLSLADLDKDIAKNKSLQLKMRYSLPATTTPAAAGGDWLSVSVVNRDPTGKSVTVSATLAGTPKPFPEAGADFRLAGTAAAFGLTLRESPARGKADMALVSSLLKDLPATHAGVKILQRWVQGLPDAEDTAASTEGAADAAPSAPTPTTP